MFDSGPGPRAGPVRRDWGGTLVKIRGVSGDDPDAPVPAAV